MWKVFILLLILFAASCASDPCLTTQEPYRTHVGGEVVFHNTDMVLDSESEFVRATPEGLVAEIPDWRVIQGDLVIHTNQIHKVVFNTPPVILTTASGEGGRVLFVHKKALTWKLKEVVVVHPCPTHECGPDVQIERDDIQGAFVHLTGEEMQILWAGVNSLNPPPSIEEQCEPTL